VSETPRARRTPRTLHELRPVTAIDEARPRVRARGFAYWYGLAFVLSSFLGFTPTYWAPLASGTPVFNPIVHLHGALFFGWTLYFFYQTHLVAERRITQHRAAGMLGVAWAPALCVIGPLVALHTLLNAEAAGFGRLGEAIVMVPLSGIAGFAVLVTLALANTRKPEIHRRLMALTAVSVIDAPWARLTRPAVDIAYRALQAGAPSPWLGIVLSFSCADVFLIALIAHDWRKHGRPHRVYLFGGAAILAVQYGRLLFVDTAAWHAFTHAFLAMVGVFPEPRP